jgi:hypothetical protein
MLITKTGSPFAKARRTKQDTSSKNKKEREIFYQCQLFTFVASARCSTIQRESPSPSLAITKQNAVLESHRRLQKNTCSLSRTASSTAWASRRD